MQKGFYVTVLLAFLWSCPAIAQNLIKSTGDKQIELREARLEKCRKAEARCNTTPSSLDYKLWVDREDVPVLVYGNCIRYAHNSRRVMGEAARKRAIEIYREMVAIAAARAASACGHCPSDEFWNSKTGKDLVKSGGSGDPKVWDQMMKQCRPQLEQVQDVSEPEPADDCEIQLPVSDKRIEIDGETTSCPALAENIRDIRSEIDELTKKNDLAMANDLTERMESILNRIDRTEFADDTSVVSILTGAVGLPTGIVGVVLCLDPPITAVCVTAATVGGVATLFGFGSSILGKANSVTVGEFKADLRDIIGRIKERDLSMKEVRRNIDERMNRANMLCTVVQRECM